MDEVPAYAPCGSGDHTFVRVEKRLRTTEEVARALARAAGVRPRDVGYAGRKDRVAVTRQWLSVPALDPEDALALEWPGVRVLEAKRHGNKLRTGQLRGNRFLLVVRGVGADAARAAERRLSEMAAVGMPNRFGSQRFGRDGDNAQLGRAVLSGEASPRDRRAARFAVSALQSEVFNEVLRRRPLPLDRLERGDIAMLEGSRGWFWVEDPEVENERAARFEISPSGPIFGTKSPLPRDAVLERETAVLADLGIPAAESWRLPRGLRVRGARRPLRVRPEAPSIRHEDGRLELAFGLPSGSYATVLIEELLGEVDDGPAPAARIEDDGQPRDDTVDGPAVS